MYERFTDRTRKVMQLANQEAQRFNHEHIGTEHILLGLVKEGSGVAANVLKNMGVDLRKIRLEIEQIVHPTPVTGDDMVTMGKLPHTLRAKKVVEYSIEEARNLNHNYVGTEHMLLGLLAENEGIAAQVLMNLGVKLENMREEVLNLLGHNKDCQKPPGESIQFQWSGALLAGLKSSPPGAYSEERTREEVRAIFGVPPVPADEILSHTFVFANGARTVVMAAVDASGNVTFSIRNLTPPPADEPHVKKS